MYVCMYIYIYMYSFYVCICIYIYIYIYVGRERERENTRPVPVTSEIGTPTRAPDNRFRIMQDYLNSIRSTSLLNLWGWGRGFLFHRWHRLVLGMDLLLGLGHEGLDVVRHEDLRSLALRSQGFLGAPYLGAPSVNAYVSLFSKVINLNVA